MRTLNRWLIKLWIATLLLMIGVALADTHRTLSGASQGRSNDWYPSAYRTETMPSWPLPIRCGTLQELSLSISKSDWQTVFWNGDWAIFEKTIPVSTPIGIGAVDVSARYQRVGHAWCNMNPMRKDAI